MTKVSENQEWSENMNKKRIGRSSFQKSEKESQHLCFPELTVEVLIGSYAHAKGQAAQMVSQGEV